MGKIDERRARTEKAAIENKAALADAPATKTEFPYKKILIAVLAVVAVIACALLIVNAIVESYSAKFRDGASIEAAVENANLPDSEKTEEVLYNGELFDAELRKYGFLASAVSKAYQNYAVQSSNVLAKDGVYNFVITVNDSKIYEGVNDNNKLATVLLLSINNGSVKIVRMNTGSLVVIPGLSVGPLYDAYRFGNAALLSKAVQENYGVKINGYIDVSLDSFMKAALEISGGNGVVLPADATHSDAIEYRDVNQLFLRIKESDKKDEMVQAVIKSVAGNLSGMKVIELKNAVKLLEDNMTAYISRDDFGDLIKMGTSILGSSSFNADEDVTTFAIQDTSAVDYNGAAGGKYYFYSTPDNYQTAVDTLQTELGLKEAK